MKQSNKDFYKVSAIVDQFLIENDLPNTFFPKALSWALRGLRELRLDTWQEVKTELLPVTDRKTVNLPDNFCDWVKCGIRKGQYVITLGINSELNTLPRTNTSPSVAGLLSQHMPNGLDFGTYEGFNFFNFADGPIFGLGAGLPSKGYFKVHDNGDCKELLLDYDYGFTEIYLEYITDGLDACGETIVHPYEYDSIFKFLEYRYEKKNNPKATNYSVNEADKDVYWANKRLRARRSRLTPQDLLNITRSEFRLTPHA